MVKHELNVTHNFSKAVHSYKSKIEGESNTYNPSNSEYDVLRFMLEELEHSDIYSKTVKKLFIERLNDIPTKHDIINITLDMGVFWETNPLLFDRINESIKDGTTWNDISYDTIKCNTDAFAAFRMSKNYGINVHRMIVNNHGNKFIMQVEILHCPLIRVMKGYVPGLVNMIEDLKDSGREDISFCTAVLGANLLEDKYSRWDIHSNIIRDVLVELTGIETIKFKAISKNSDKTIVYYHTLIK